ncbi:hypothetical protein OUZ56_014641 [Daphnia magna]|uniref:Uncharacterized protein n=1 Tax=Daphnia magna TaxID=35525 RepID=A0ABR0AKE3_9CRUS|nr:hypothetical protein OUZ56_014641 [Daphnia magna]
MPETVSLDYECVGPLPSNHVGSTTALHTTVWHNPDYTSSFTTVRQCSLNVTKHLQTKISVSNQKGQPGFQFEKKIWRSIVATKQIRGATRMTLPIQNLELFDSLRLGRSRILSPTQFDECGHLF